MKARHVLEGVEPSNVAPVATRRVRRRRGSVDTPYAGSWADQEQRRPRVPITPEEERQRRAGIVHPSIANARRLGEDDAPLSRTLSRSISNPSKEHFPDVTIPPEIEALAMSGELTDRSWYNEPGPSFVVADKWDRTLACPALMVMPDDPAEREESDWKRFHVFSGDGGNGLPNDTFETDDVNEALAKLRELSAAYTPRPEGDLDDEATPTDVVDSLLDAGDARRVFEEIPANTEPYKVEKDAAEAEYQQALRVIELLKAHKIDASWEYPGWLNVPTPPPDAMSAAPGAGEGLAVGTINGFWSAQPYAEDGAIAGDEVHTYTPAVRTLSDALEKVKPQDAKPEDIAALIVAAYDDMADRKK